MCAKKCGGSLELKEARLMNEAMIFEFGQGMIEKKDSLWVRILMQNASNVVPTIRQRGNASNV